MVGTLGAGTYVTEQAREVVSKYNLSQISHVLEIYYVEDSKYPQSLEEVVRRGEVKNLNVADYSYELFGDTKDVKVCEIKINICWTSLVGLDGFEPSTSTL